MTSALHNLDSREEKEKRRILQFRQKEVTRYYKVYVKQVASLVISPTVAILAQAILALGVVVGG